MPSFKKHFLKKSKKLVYLVLIGLLGLSISLFTNPNLGIFNISKSAELEPLNSQIIFQMVNSQRTSKGGTSLIWNTTIASAAQAKAQDMATNQYFNHYRPSDNKRGVSYIKDQGYKYLSAGENLGVFFDEESDLVASWMASSSHKANILNSNFKETGIGLSKAVYQGFETYFVVQMFAEPIVNQEKLPETNSHPPQASPKPEATAPPRPVQVKTVKAAPKAVNTPPATSDPVASRSEEEIVQEIEVVKDDCSILQNNIILVFKLIFKLDLQLKNDQNC